MTHGLARAAVTLIGILSPLIGCAQPIPTQLTGRNGNREAAAMIEQIRTKHDLPALAVAVILDGKTAVTAAVGYRKYGDPTPVTVDDRFHLGSDTKSMTATLCAMLVEQGKLRWDSTLAEAFPECVAAMAPELKMVTLEMLLCHRSGLSSRSWPASKTFLQMHQLPGDPRQQRALYANMMLAEKPEAPPGSKFIYSNANFALAGIMAERAANVAWEELITQRLFRPRGMTTTGFGAMGTPGKLDQPWQHRMDNGVRVSIGPGPFSDNPEVIGPAGTVHCSIGDWAKYIELHLNGEQGGARLLTPATLQRLHT